MLQTQSLLPQAVNGIHLKDGVIDNDTAHNHHTDHGHQVQALAEQPQDTQHSEYVNNQLAQNDERLYQTLKLSRQDKEQQQNGDNQNGAEFLDHLTVGEIGTRETYIKPLVLTNRLLYHIHNTARLATLHIQNQRIELTVHAACNLLQVTVTGLLKQYLQRNTSATGLDITALNQVLGLLGAHTDHNRH